MRAWESSLANFHVLKHLKLNMALPLLSEKAPIHIAWASGYPILHKGKSLENLDQNIRSFSAHYQVPLESNLSELLIYQDYYANSPSSRALNLAKLFTNPEVKKIWFGKAGFGAIETAVCLENFIKTEDLQQLNPKWLIGFSDATLWHLWGKRFSWPFLHAPNLVNIREVQSGIMSGANPDTSGEELCNLLTGKQNHIEHPLEHIAGPKPESFCEKLTLMGGNLSIILRNLAHPTLGLQAKDLHGKFLFLEDTKEDSVRAHSLLTSLAASGILHSSKGIIFGDYPLEGKDLKEMILVWHEEILVKALCLKLPIYHLKNCGHGPLNRPLPLNYPGTLKTANDTHKLEFSFQTQF